VNDSEKYYRDTNEKITFLGAIKKNMYGSKKVIKGKSKSLHYTKSMNSLAKVVLKLIYGCIQPGESRTVSWDHKLLSTMIMRREQVFLSKYIFNHMCDCIKEQRRIIPYG